MNSTPAPPLAIWRIASKSRSASLEWKLAVGSSSTRMPSGLCQPSMARASATMVRSAGESRPIGMRTSRVAPARRTSLAARACSPRRRPGQQVAHAEGSRQVQVLCRAQRLDETEVLVDEVQLLASRLSNSGGVTSAVEDLDPAARVRLVHSSQHLDQRRFPRAVLTHDREHLAAVQVERDFVECLGPGEGFGDTTDPQEHRCLIRRTSAADSDGVVVPYGHSEANRLVTSG